MSRLLASFEKSTEAKVRLGITPWNANVEVPLTERVNATAASMRRKAKQVSQTEAFARMSCPQFPGG
jgi:hypothetical protein